MDTSTIVALVVGAALTGLVGWLMQRHLRVPGRVNALEQAMQNYLPLIGTADSPGAQALIRRVDALEIRLETQETQTAQAIDTLRNSVESEFKLLRQETLAESRIVASQLEGMKALVERIANGIDGAGK